ncbi:MAG: hypothetical protein ACQEQF_00575 [Bacillota bacterium]
MMIYVIGVQPTNWSYTIEIEAESEYEALCIASVQENVDLEYLKIIKRKES